jgi:hypothetical protein
VKPETLPGQLGGATLGLRAAAGKAARVDEGLTGSGGMRARRPINEPAGGFDLAEKFCADRPGEPMEVRAAAKAAMGHGEEILSVSASIRPG